MLNICQVSNTRRKLRWLRSFFWLTWLAMPGVALWGQNHSNPDRVQVTPLPSLPDEIGVAGPLVGVHQNVLIAAGGANFGPADAPDLWDLPKIYHDRVWGMDTSRRQWHLSSSRLSQPVAYAAVVNTPYGILCIGGENATGPTNRGFLLTPIIDGQTLDIAENDQAVPDMHWPFTGGGAAVVDDYIYVVLGNVVLPGETLTSSRLVCRLPLQAIHPDRSTGNGIGHSHAWQVCPAWPAPSAPASTHDKRRGATTKVYPLVTAQHDGFGNRLFVLGGRHFPAGTDTSDPGNLVFARDCWSFDPGKWPAVAERPFFSADWSGSTGPWKRLADAPVPISAGTAVPCGPAHILVPAYATGEVLQQQLDSGTPMQAFEHPGFPKQILAYHTITDTWTTIGEMPAAQVTTPAVRWGDDIVLVSGEIRPRVRTNQVWSLRVPQRPSHFGWFNMSIVIVYLLAMLSIGFRFSRRNRSTDAYFRGGKHIPWWVAGCSIFATMLSSITYMAIPSKAFAQDWVYAVGNLMILAVAPIAIYVALPFFRRLDVTSAYEYLEKRFNRPIRLIGSGSFSLFHVFRMGVVLALAGLALSSVTPWTASQCVLVMGLLSIVYCTLGGIEAVVWTDTIQTFILMGGAILCVLCAWFGAGQGSLQAAVDSGKLHLINPDFTAPSFTSMAIWVVILGGIGQNVSSYTADQTVVQRYMTTANQKQAARSIWLNGLMAVPAALLFFGMGTGFWMFYRSHPEKLDPAMPADRILPHFISQELPIGLAGLVVAGIFAAAQSTVSTSMNSGATTIVTDFLRPFRFLRTEQAYLWAARLTTLAMGIAGTCTGLLFIDPNIKSLFDEFIGILGMFLGVLAGLFTLGVTSRRANHRGSLFGAAFAICFMFSLMMAAKGKTLAGCDFRGAYDALGWEIYRVNAYLYAVLGIAVCHGVGYLASILTGSTNKDLTGLTLWDTPRHSTDP